MQWLVKREEVRFTSDFFVPFEWLILTENISDHSIRNSLAMIV